MKKTRSLNCVFVGHVDHGKTSILDRIRGSSIAKHEPGLITQAISDYTIDFKTIEKNCGELIKGKEIKIPGILAIDSPGHAAFTNLRKRGGSLADIAILVIDINEGFKPQTHEAIEILKHYKTPFVVAANKIDLIPGWHNKNKILVYNLNAQSESTRKLLDNKIYNLVAKFYELGFNSERFDRVQDYSKQVAIIPLSAKTGEGIPELLLVLTGLAQKFLEKDLQVDVDKPGKATVLEVKGERGFGKVIDIILYDGSIKENDVIVIGGVDNAIVTKVRGLFQLEGNKLKKEKRIDAASAIRIFAPGLELAYAGMPVKIANKDLEKIKKEIQAEVEEVLIHTDKAGIVIKSDKLGSLEALVNLLKEKNIKIKKASLGEITKKDITDASSDNNELNKVILGFNIKNIKVPEVKIITGEVIYTLLEEFDKWLIDAKKKIETKQLSSIVKPFKIRILHGYVFRQSNPAVMGVEVLLGTLKTNVALLKKNGVVLPEIKGIQKEGKNINQVPQGENVAISVQGIIVGRQIDEGDILYSDITENNFRKLKEMKKLLNNDEVECLKEIIEIKRKTNTLWGV
ncbi:MAG: translation initiation factor IF-2 [Nanoarchaeota archaeon]